MKRPTEYFVTTNLETQPQNIPQQWEVFDQNIQIFMQQNPYEKIPLQNAERFV